MHQENNYPIKERGDWDIGLPDGTDDEPYLEHLATALPRILDTQVPDLVMMVAGADPYREDPYSPLDLGHDDLRARDEIVFRTALRRRIPIAWVLAGGYTHDVSKVVEVHLNTFRAASMAAAEAPTQDRG